MEDLIKYQLESLSSQRDKLISELIRVDYEKTNHISEVVELKNAITEVDARIDSMINRLVMKTIRDTPRSTMTDEEMVKDYPRLAREYALLHQDYREAIRETLIIN